MPNFTIWNAEYGKLPDWGSFSIYKASVVHLFRDLCKIPIFGTFLRNALLERLKIFNILCAFCDAVALNCAQIWGFAKVSFRAAGQPETTWILQFCLMKVDIGRFFRHSERNAGKHIKGRLCKGFNPASATIGSASACRAEEAVFRFCFCKLPPLVFAHSKKIIY